MINTNRVLNDEDRVRYEDSIRIMFQLCPDMMSRKIPEANVQQAFVFDYISEHFNKETRMLCVGSFEDTAYESLRKSGFSNITAIDPELNIDLNEFWNQNHEKEGFEVIFATSVLEHVNEDELFISQICDLLVEGGVGILTCDFNDDYIQGDAVPATVIRQYTLFDLSARLRNTLYEKNCFYFGGVNWTANKDFHMLEFDYDFATMVFAMCRAA